LADPGCWLAPRFEHAPPPAPDSGPPCAACHPSP
jgi:hypothetical protein